MKRSNLALVIAAAVVVCVLAAVIIASQFVM